MTNPEIIVVTAPGQNAFFTELATALVSELQALGAPARIVVGDFPEPSWKTVFVLLPPHEYVALAGPKLLDRHDLLARTITISAEQPSSVWFANNIALACAAGAAFDINPRAVTALRQHRPDAALLQLGYTPSWDRFDPERFGDPHDGRTVDVLVLASYTGRRSEQLARCADVLWRRQTYLVLSGPGPNSETNASFFAGPQKLDLLRRSRVLLNIHRDDEPYFEWLRAIEAMHCGAVFVTEESTGMSPLVPGEHVLSARPEALSHVLEAAIDDPPRLARLRQAAYDLLRERPLRDGAAALLDAARGLLDRPVPSQGLEADLQAWKPAAAQPTALSSSVDAGVVRTGLKDLRLDMMEVRRTIGAQLVGGDATRRTDVVHTSPGWRTSQPRVSVITAVYNHASMIGHALESARHSSHDAFELVIVDDGSVDGSSDAVLQFAHAHPSVPLLLLRHAVNRGLGVARNTAWRAARGELIFVLDADNLVLPTTLSALEVALDAQPEAAAAYGAIACFDDTGPTYLLSCLAWDPMRLRSGNYIDAMAMIRRSVLETHGGYTTDRRLYGWEDYDLWCSLAEAREHAVFVPNVVARYRDSRLSMRALSDMSQYSAFAALRERHPTLMAGVEAPL